MRTARYIRTVLYKLKKDYGQLVVFRSGAIVNDDETGEITRTPTSTTVKKAIVLDAKSARKIALDIPWPANGGWIDMSERLVIMKAADVDPLDEGMVCRFNSLDWVVTKAFPLDVNLGRMY